MILLYVLLVFISVLMGTTIFQVLKKRYIFYKELIDFLDYYKQNLLYLQNSIPMVIDSLMSRVKETKELLEDYKEKKNDEDFYLKIPQYISETQKGQINQIFKYIGFGDVDVELEKTEKARSCLLEQCDRSREIYDKYGVLSIKLSFLLGILLVILLI